MFSSGEELVNELRAAGCGEAAVEIGALARPALLARRHGSGVPLPQQPGFIIGGLPRVPEGVAWPYREPLPHADAFLAWLKRPGISAVWSSRQPLTYFGEIDLEICSGLVPDWQWPISGRLLLFFEPLCGCYGQGVANGRVLWFETPRDDCPVLAFPLADYPDEESGYPPVLPERAVPLDLGWSCPDRGILDFAFGKAEDGSDPWRSDGFDELFWRRIHAWSDEGKRWPHRIGGWAAPIQHDPTFEAEAEHRGLTDVPVSWETLPDEVAFLSAIARWSLLCQIEIEDAYQELAEGAIYFMVPTEDGRVGRFDRACAIYQQS